MTPPIYPRTLAVRIADFAMLRVVPAYLLLTVGAIPLAFVDQELADLAIVLATILGMAVAALVPVVFLLDEVGL